MSIFGVGSRVLAAVLTMGAVLAWPSVPHAQAPAIGFFDSGGVPIHYEVIGHGPPVLLIHGFGASFERARVPAPLLDALADYELIGMDVRGFGKSGKPDEPSAYGIEVTRDVVRLLDHLGRRQAHLLGLSMGGIIALKTAALYPDRVASVMLGSQGWLTREELDDMARSGAAVAASPTAELPDGLREAVEQTGRHVFTGFVQAYPALYVTPDELDRLRMPILAVLGSKDERVSRGEALRARHPQAELMIVPGLDHVGTLIDARFAGAVKRFLDEHR